VLTLLASSERFGRLVLGMTEASLFGNEVHRLLFGRLRDYWAKYRRPPGIVHTSDLVADILDDREHQHGDAVRLLLRSIAAASSREVNASYVLDMLKTFRRMVAFQRAILESAQRLASQKHLALEDLEEMWNQVLAARHLEFAPGMRLRDHARVLAYLHQRPAEFSTGIEPFDKAGVCPRRGKTMLFLAPSGYGKTWFAVNCGKRAFFERKRVLHLTLGDLSEEEVLGRYYQALFAVPWAAVPEDATGLTSTLIKRSPRGHFAELEEVAIEPQFNLARPEAGDNLQAYIDQYGARADNLIVKAFPSRTLTIAKLEAYLDSLELVEKFIPDLILLDYLGVLRTAGSNAADRRVAIGQQYEEWRRVLDERSIAGVAMHQANRKGMQSKDVLSTHVAEDISLINTSDYVITHSATAPERQRKLARLWVAKARAATDQFGALITQNYPIGQYCIDAVHLTRDYSDYMATQQDREAELEQLRDQYRQGDQLDAAE